MLGLKLNHVSKRGLRSNDPRSRPHKSFEFLSFLLRGSLPIWRIHFILGTNTTQEVTTYVSRTISRSSSRSQDHLKSKSCFVQGFWHVHCVVPCLFDLLHMSINTTHDMTMCCATFPGQISKVKVTQVFQSFYGVCSVASCLFNRFPSSVAQI